MTPALNAYEFVFLIFYHDGENDGENDNLLLILRRCRSRRSRTVLPDSEMALLFLQPPIFLLLSFAVLRWLHQ